LHILEKDYTYMAGLQDPAVPKPAVFCALWAVLTPVKDAVAGRRVELLTVERDTKLSESHLIKNFDFLRTTISACPWVVPSARTLQLSMLLLDEEFGGHLAKDTRRKCVLSW
jgi:hypothetical protein